MSTLFVRELVNVDFSYLDAERGLVGETWLVDVELDGALNDDGMVFDFGHIKPLIRSMVEGEIDHKLLVPTQSVKWLEDSTDEQPQLRFELANGGVIEHKSPAQALCLIDAETINPTIAAAHMCQLLESKLPENVHALRLTLRPELIDSAFYHYSHGLRGHFGDCQRIAHGHRSRIEVFINGQRQPVVESRWAERWRDIYIGSREDLQPDRELDGQTHHCFAYTAAQGDFEITVPAVCCELMDTDSTVELIAEFVRQELQQETGEDAVRVVAYEGLCKGAIAG